jgi:hypothetical protein
MTTAQANQILARYCVTLTQHTAPSGAVICTTETFDGHLTQWYAGQTPEAVIAAYQRSHGF